MKICRVATVPFFLYNHLRGQIMATIDAGHDVTLISSNGPETQWLASIPGVKFREIEIPRKISLLRDLHALWQLYWFFRRAKFDIVHSTTPKAGMLCAIAAFFSGVPIRLHTFTGQAWSELHGMIRYIAKAGDRLTAKLDTFCYTDSLSQAEFIVSEKVCKKEQIRVLGAGSLAGVDLGRFDSEKWSGTKESTRAELGIPDGYRVVTFIGRIVKDKGIDELVAAFNILREEGCKCKLLLIGPLESKDGALSASHQGMDNPDICAIGYSREPERYLAVTDVFCLPSYREGFGNVVIEAGAMGVPTVGTDIIGLRDAVINGETGRLVPQRDSEALADALRSLLNDEVVRTRMGKAARERAVSEFSAENVNAAVLSEYKRLFSENEK